MRKLQACVLINAPVQVVRRLTEKSHRRHWLRTSRPTLIRTTSESVVATEVEGGTQLQLQVEYQARVPFLEPLIIEGFPESVVSSLSRLKEIAESTPST